MLWGMCTECRASSPPLCTLCCREDPVGGDDGTAAKGGARCLPQHHLPWPRPLRCLLAAHNPIRTWGRFGATRWSTEERERKGESRGRKHTPSYTILPEYKTVSPFLPVLFAFPFRIFNTEMFLWAILNKCHSSCMLYSAPTIIWTEE